MSMDVQALNFSQSSFGIGQAFDASFDSGWVSFPGHYLIYAATGAFRLMTAELQWLLPPQRAAWVRAGTPMRILAEGPGTTRSVLFAAESIAAPPFASRVFGVTPLAREMLIRAARWGPQRESTPPEAERFFVALADVCYELAAEGDGFWLPRARSPELARVIDYLLAHLDADPGYEQAAAVACLSARTLARRFITETGLSWSQFLQRARMIRALELLAGEAKVIEVAGAVGYSSVSAFNQAFRVFSGETPTAYRRRLATGYY